MGEIRIKKGNFMKTKGMIAVALGFGVLLATGCNGCGGNTSALAIGANWYSDVGLQDIGGTEETLEYEVTFTPPQSQGSLKVEYETGKYTVSLVSMRDEETNQLAYELTSTLNISGKYTEGTEVKKTFDDEVISRAVFLSARQQLRPLRSYKKVKSTPSYGGVITSYEYETTTTYASDLATMSVTTTDLTVSGKSETKEYPVKNGGTFFDNEQILFAIRGFDLTAARTFYTFNPSAKEMTGATVTPTAQSEMKFDSLTIGGESRERSIPYYEAELRYTSTPSGQVQRLRYAKLVNPSANTYRNLLLYMSVPLSDSMGSLVYTLTSADLAK